MYKQKVIKRYVNDYEHELIEDFVGRVNAEINKMIEDRNFAFANIQYVNEDVAIIGYWDE